MEFKVYAKPEPASFRKHPNLPDLEKARAHFSWDDVGRELSWLPGGNLNMAHECIDRHATGTRRGKIALYWEGRDGHTETYTFAELKNLSDRFANVLKVLGVRKGDRVFFFLERIPEIFVALFGTLKLGAVAGPLFSAFGPDAIRDRLADCNAKILITSPELRGRVEEVKSDLPALEHLIIVDKGGREATPLKHYEIDYFRAMEAASDHFVLEPTSPDDFSIIHYTSGTTGKPKGAVHRHKAILGQYLTARHVLDLHEDDVYWCTADPGWVTGTSYGMFGPWSIGVPLVFFEGPFSAEGWYKILEKYKVTVWYTAPTAIRMLMKAGEEIVKKFDLSALRHMASVGEPLNPEAIYWGEKAFGLVFHDNWWQTETGCMQIANLPTMTVKAGSMGRPLPGVTAAVLDDRFNPLPNGSEGLLALKPEWPSQFRTYWNRPDVYDSRFKNGWYLTGDRARTDTDGYFWFVGRADDVINTAGHLVGPFEVESALIEHPAVAEAAVIGKPDEERGEIVKAFVSLRAGFTASEELEKDIKNYVRKRLAAHAYPREIAFLPSLPKTRSGKIMRRLLKARELGLPEGDTSTLED
ncbi:MAG: acetate--CoA ligase [Candidatus Wallbacteria bacterium]|nr:acetate--CoA ligase [Candidatus Wallbacteria bacterium]